MKVKKKVLVGGCFDILHFGHIKFLKMAKRKGDILIVALESDTTTKRLKGNGRPIHSQEERKEILESLKFVDKVIALPVMNSDADYFKLVKKVKPDYIAITEGDSAKQKKKIHATSVGAQVFEIKKVRDLSSTKLAKLIGLE